MARVYVEGYGCSANMAHEEAMKGVLAKRGHELCGIEEAEFAVINTCIVKASTEAQMKRRIRELGSKKLIIAGCMPKAQEEVVRSLAPMASLLGPFSSFFIADAIERMEKGERVLIMNREAVYPEEKLRENKFINVCEISHGCVDSCSYCATKLAKGHLKSFPAAKIAEDAKNSLKDGCKEIWLTSQDNACYGEDTGGTLSSLVKSICSINGEFRIRVGMMTPSGVMKRIDDMLEMFENEKVYKFLHVPVQSGSDRVLREMKRRYTKEEFVSMVLEFRKKHPEINVWTDVIVGYPGETDKDFEETLDVLKAISADYAHVSRFSPMKGTLASQFVQIASGKAKERSRVATRLCEALTFNQNSKWVGKESRILVTETGSGENQLMGKNEAYKQVVFNGPKELIGTFCDVRITKAELSHLKAVIL